MLSVVPGTACTIAAAAAVHHCSRCMTPEAALRLQARSHRKCCKRGMPTASALGTRWAAACMLMARQVQSAACRIASSCRSASRCSHSHGAPCGRMLRLTLSRGHFWKLPVCRLAWCQQLQARAAGWLASLASRATRVRACGHTSAQLLRTCGHTSTQLLHA
jgi:hypothetical protein